MKKTAFLALLASTMVASPAIAATTIFEGGKVHTKYLFPSQGDVFEDFGDKKISGDTLVARGLGSSIGSSLYASLYVFGSNIRVIYDSSEVWSNTDFNGFVLSDAGGTIPSFTSVVINSATNMVGFNASRITFDANHIYVNWQGLSFNPSTVVSLDVSGSVMGAVPEPATWAMMIGGFGVVGGAMRRRKAAVRTTVSFA